MIFLKDKTAAQLPSQRSQALNDLTTDLGERVI